MTLPEDQLPEDAATDFPPEEEFIAEPGEDETKSEDSEDEGEAGSGGDGKKGGGGKKPGVDVKIEDAFFDDEDLSEYDSETLIEKLKLLAWAPFSMMVPGASAFESESELKRKLFLGEIGLRLNEFEPHDIADPDLIAKLERRLQQRQEALAQNQAQMMAAAAGVAAAAGGLAAMPEIPDPASVRPAPPQPKEIPTPMPKDPGAIRREETARMPEPAKTESAYQAEKKETDYSADRKPEEAKPDMAATAMLLMPEPSFADDIELTAQKENSAAPIDTVSPSSISNLFVAAASVTDYAVPQQKTDFKLPDPAPKLDTGGGPLG